MSANGYLLERDGVQVSASWAAPYFVLQDKADEGEPWDPWLIHCDDLPHALRHLRYGGTLLGADFTVIERVAS